MSKSAKEVLDARKSVKVLDSHMSYLDTGVGENAVVFLHGNPTAAFLWRNIIPCVRSMARCLAPDLIGMGHSGKLNIEYKYAEHYPYLSTWMDQMDLPKKITIVCHDWGSGLGFNWCYQNPGRVQAIVHMESLVGPVPGWDLWPEMAVNIFKALRSNAGEELILKKNFFVERLLIGGITRELSEEEMSEYRAPYLEENSRMPTLTWPREIPVMTDGPDNVVKIATDYNQWLSRSSHIPKLYIDGDPGFFSPLIRMGIHDWPNQKTVKVKGLHFLQEDSPDEIGVAIRDFLQEVYKK